MPEIKLETPEGRNAAEMTLVRMLKKHRSWHDVTEITSALWRVGFIADAMEREAKHLAGSGTQENTED